MQKEFRLFNASGSVDFLFIIREDHAMILKRAGSRRSGRRVTVAEARREYAAKIRSGHWFRPGRR